MCRFIEEQETSTVQLGVGWAWAPSWNETIAISHDKNVFLHHVALLNFPFNFFLCPGRHAWTRRRILCCGGINEPTPETVDIVI